MLDILDVFADDFDINDSEALYLLINHGVEGLKERITALEAELQAARDTIARYENQHKETATP